MILLVQMVRGVTVALGCGGLLGRVMAVVGTGSVDLVGDDMSAVSGVAFVFAMAVADLLPSSEPVLDARVMDGGLGLVVTPAP